jgi:hypothetical protein
MYPIVRFPEDVHWTLGLAYDDYQEGPINKQKVSPKLGVQWEVTNRIRLRAAVFRTVKPALIANRTIQPTQVAGFNQFFDDINGTEAWSYGTGLDIRLADSLYAGTEVIGRDLDLPVAARMQDANESEFRTYIYWTPTAELSITGELQLTSFDHDNNRTLPSLIETLNIPLTVRYFSPSGLFGGIGGTFVRQDVNRPRGTTTNEGTDTFFVMDGAIGYRFPQRRGQISLEATNLFDTNFRYQDDTFRTAGDESQVSRYIPRRTVFGRLTMNF